MLALAFLARPADPTRAAHNRTPIDLTLSQIRRLIGMLLVPPTRTLTTLLHCPPGAGTTRPPPDAITTSDDSPPRPPPDHEVRLEY
ncbi:hypothetical protein [Actinacidiphila soli]|uniref:hypothetical protein n=1 Tax=Actinacidiphila soli TaxID=2487275 RepID=UPI000FCA5557|nr:hypothetical protein [Actinacidiphila soli]